MNFKFYCLISAGRHASRIFRHGYRALHWQAQPGGTTYGFTLHLCYRPYSTTRFTSDARKPKIQVAFFNKNAVYNIKAQYHSVF